MTSHELARQLRLRFGNVLSEPVVFRDEVTLKLTDAERIGEICTHAKRTLRFDLLLDITSVDHYGEDPRWTVVYELYSLTHRCHLRLKTDVSEEKSELPSVTKVWATANWHEREIYDLMGIRFRWHPDLRRIIMWEGYPYHPLRKDFPLGGKPTELPDIAFTKTAPIEGGPFVTSPGGRDTIEREPRAKTPEN